MVNGCTVCSNNRRKYKNISYFTYPKDINRTYEWLKVVGREDLRDKLDDVKLRKSYRICEEHFEKNYIKYSKKKTVKYLTRDAFPTLNLPLNDGTTNQYEIPIDNQVQNMENYLQFKSMDINQIKMEFVPKFYYQKDDTMAGIKAEEIPRRLPEKIEFQGNIIPSASDATYFCVSGFDTSHVQPQVKIENDVLEDNPDTSVPSIHINIEMEHDGEIKQEIIIEENSLQCRICLSVGRKMLPLEKYEELYKMLLFDKSQDANNDIFSMIEVCWECHAMLRNVDRFQKKVNKSRDMLQSQQNIVSLSSLTTVTFSDSNPDIIYLIEEDVRTDNIKIEIESDDQIEANDEQREDIQNEIDKRTDDEKIKKKKVKKPKFKSVNDFNETFKSVHLNCNILKDILEERRNEDSYKISDFKCSTCIQSFDNKNNLLDHNNKYHNEVNGIYICDICQSRFSDIGSLSSHLSSHYHMFYCKLCNFKCSTEGDKRRHARTHGAKTLKCLKCDRLFIDRREFYDHHRKKHELFICDFCGLNFKMRYSLVKHIRKKHTKPECKLCNKKFSRYNSLWLHNKVFHGPPSESAYCVECDIKYADVYRYKWHLANSIKHRPRKIIRVPCPGCDKEFSKKIYMKNHYDLVHLKLIKFQCADCQKYFGRNADLVKHRRRVHDGVQPPKNKICQICGRGFSTNSILANHMRTHTGERPFACSRCPAAFAQAAALAGHAKNLHPD